MRAFENIGLMAILLSGILHYKKEGWSRLLERVNLGFCILFLLCIFGFFYADNTGELSRKTGLKVLLMLFPLGFSFAPPITHKVKRLSIIVFNCITCLLAVLTCADYFLHFEAYNIIIQQSKPIDIVGGTMHIYFSMMLALSVLLGLHLLNKDLKLVLNNIWDKIVLATIVINVLALHILTARTGLFAFYVAVVALLIRIALKTRRFKLLIGGLVVITLFPVIMYKAVPSVRNRIDNTYEDLSRYFSGKYVGYYSISGRFETWKAAWHIFEDHPLLGVSYGDLQDHIEAQYKIDNTRLMREERLPNCHNQYIETLAAQGIVGFAAFVFLLIAMFREVKKAPRNNHLLFGFMILFLTGFMVESLLEREAGITLFLFFFYLVRNHAYDSEKKTLVAP
jgi:O-antigen ligase